MKKIQFKMGKGKNRNFIEEYIKRANKHMKSLMSSAIEEM